MKLDEEFLFLSVCLCRVDDDVVIGVMEKRQNVPDETSDLVVSLSFIIVAFFLINETFYVKYNIKVNLT